MSSQPQPTAPEDTESASVAVSNLGKMYRIYDRPVDRLKEMLHLDRRPLGRDFWALRDVSFAVQPGESYGIIGRNGSGKSTLLQLVAQTLAPTAGVLSSRGRVAALLELGSGFNPEFTGRENVFLNGAILGLSETEMADRLEEILAFAEIGDFVDQPVKYYSSGMAVRLAFAVQAHVEADVLIVDEALAVGDVFFQQKCFEHIRALKRRGVTILYVSHDLGSVEAICDRALLLDAGRAVFEGLPKEAAARYYGLLGRELGAGQRLAGAQAGAAGETAELEVLRSSSVLTGQRRHGPRELELLAARVTNASGQDTLSVPMMESLRFELLLRAHRPVAVPLVGLHLHDRFGKLVFAAGNAQLRTQLPALEAGESLAVRLELGLRVAPGDYTFDLGAYEPVALGDPNVGVVQDSHEGLGPLHVGPLPDPPLPFYGVAQLPLSLACTFKGQA